MARFFGALEQLNPALETIEQTCDLAFEELEEDWGHASPEFDPSDFDLERAPTMHHTLVYQTAINKTS
ncbi:hypothetical protein FQN55_009288 [Onygenales sp. PD_40]|nr:hypothetical protein FQN55_009288 [Onygenales sp. PD_40]KAK2781949.1 hypothetical protein FQN52_001260 [Onygenales sp. PD_12]